MKKKTYQAESINEAMLKVKMDLGEDAVIIETREIQRGGIFGFFSETAVEVDACLSNTTSQSNGQNRVQKNNGTQKRNGKNRNIDKNPEKKRVETKNSKKEQITNSGTENQNVNFHEEIDEPAVPDFSPRERAQNLIAQKELGNQSSSNRTYDRPTPEDQDKNQFDSNRSDNGSSGNSFSSSEHNFSSKTISRLIENTSILTDKVEDLASSIESEKNEMKTTRTDFEGKIKVLYQHLLKKGVRKRYAKEMMAQTKRDLEPDEINNLETVIQQTKSRMADEFDPPRPMEPTTNETMIVPLIGPTGVGKTTTLAKMAAYFSVQESRSVGFISFDTYRLAAVEQLTKYANILKVPIQDVTSNSEFKKAVETMNKETDIIFVDTAGRSQFDQGKLHELDQMLGSDFKMKNHLVIDCSNRMEDINDILDGFDDVGFDRFVITKLDETNYHGSILNLVKQTDKPIAYLTDGQDVPDDLKMMNPEELAEIIMDPDNIQDPKHE